MSTITALFSKATGERRRAGEVLFQEGSRGTTMYIVRAGEVLVTVAGRAIARVGPGGIVGEMALIDMAARSATATATTDSELIPIDQKNFLRLVQEAPFFALEVIHALTLRLRAMNEYAFNE
jgi:CRP-like cAMP-binding protein